MCKVYTGYHGRQSMVCAPVLSVIPSLKLGGYLSVQVHKPCSISKARDYLSIQAHKPCSISKAHGLSLHSIQTQKPCSISPFLEIISPYRCTNHALSLKLGDYLSIQVHKPCSISKARGLSLQTGTQTMLYLSLPGDYLSKQAHKPCSISPFPKIISPNRDTNHALSLPSEM